LAVPELVADRSGHASLDNLQNTADGGVTARSDASEPIA